MIAGILPIFEPNKFAKTPLGKFPIFASPQHLAQPHCSLERTYIYLALIGLMGCRKPRPAGLSQCATKGAVFALGRSEMPLASE
jgi:hypothetical protein